MSFFPDSIKNPRARELSETLRDAIRSNKKGFPPAASLKSWEKVFVSLFNSQGEEETVKALTWYVKHMNDEYVPQAYSANTFKEKFHRIMAAMKQSEDGEIGETVLPEDRDMAETLLSVWTLPGAIASLLPVIIHRSRSEWIRFVNRAVARKKSLRSRESNFINNILIQNGPTFLREWMVALCRRYTRPGQYSYSPLKLAFSADSELFKNFWRQWSQEWCSDPNGFDALLEELKK
jgi:hypothetical protein